MTEPEILVDDHHGQYMMQLLVENFTDHYKKQFVEKTPVWVQEAIKSVEHPDHVEACVYITDYVDFQTEEGIDFRIDYAEGGLYAIAISFYETPEAEAFFNS